MRIGIDLDGCVYDYVDALRRYLVGTRVYSDPADLPEPTGWDIWSSWGMPRSEFFTASAMGIAEGTVFGTGDPYEGARAGLHWLDDAGHTLHIVTARRRQPRAISLTAAWLAEHRLPYSTLTFSSDKTVVPCDVFVEDNVDNAVALAEAGCRPILLARPWNDHAPAEIVRVQEWWEVVALVNTIAPAVAIEAQVCS